MLDFEEELKKFRPSPEIDQVEDNVYKNNLADVQVRQEFSLVSARCPHRQN